MINRELIEMIIAHDVEIHMHRDHRYDDNTVIEITVDGDSRYIRFHKVYSADYPDSFDDYYKNLNQYVIDSIKLLVDRNKEVN